MQTVVDKEWLLGVLAKNRENHLATFEKAWKAYQDKAIQQMQKNLAAAREGKGLQLFIRMVQPQNETSSYDRVIGMLAENTQGVVELDEEDWQKFVQDKWDWSDQFINSTQSYVAVDNPPEF